MSKMVGGISQEAKPVDDTVKEICEKIRSELEGKIGKKFEQFSPLSYKTQLVNGVNYFIKVKVADNEHYHIRAHKAFSGEVTLAAHEANKSESDEIGYIQA
ncbi:intracellular cystatin-like protein [Dinothrombium tinctorium]|uniref:Intracellular cystatin-like protein n=1 Tax=Dinothrombium tinctorium TaxID=1965070 RepID=A0A3S3QKK8_9ACAR|nr:intracellular cystatin-like protein [Dinothrombium tinctorium]RWS10208.1 intracellular cystatin-like protein [Dinothrombium tinctorium]RWS10555.1 intracellular cystatin-like protein [Dinothrombium tinctorium]